MSGAVSNGTDVMAESSQPIPRFLRLIDWAAPCEGSPIERWRHRILGGALLSLTVLLLVPVTTAVVFGLREGAATAVIVDVVAYGLLVALLLGRRLPYTWRVAVVLGLLAAIGAFFTLSFGPVSSSLIWLLALPVAASLFLGMRAGLLGLAFSMACAGYVGVGIARGTEVWALVNDFSIGRWVIICATLLVMGTFLSLATAVLAAGLGNEATARASAESERARLAEAMEQSDVMVMLVLADGQVTYANAAGRAIAAMVRFADLEPWPDLLRGNSWHGTLEVSIPDVGPIPLSGTLYPVRQPDGTLVHILATLRDVRRERALEERMRHDQRLAAIGTLAGGIAHDFNNLLLPISGNAEVARTLLPAEHPAHAALVDIEHTADRGRLLVRRILSFSRPEQDVRGPLDLGNLVQETVRLLGATIPSSIRIETSLEPKVVVEAEPGELQQVLLNLANNAADAMPTGGVLSIIVQRLIVAPNSEVAHDLPGHAHVACLEVRDSGTGMDAATLARIFEPFFSTKGRLRGSGLGLSMVNGTVRALGGVVHPVSSPGVGTTMRIYLPLSTLRVPTPMDTPVIQPVSADRLVIVVDDEETVRRAVVRLLERQGWRAIAFPTGAEAIQALDTGALPRIDAALTDYSMPEMSGAEFARRFRARHPDVPVVLMTGFLEGEATSVADDSVVAAVLPKPFTSGELRDVMMRVFAALPQ